MLTAGGCDGVTVGVKLCDDVGTCVAGVVVVVLRGCVCAAGAGSGDGAGVVAGARCGLGPAARAGAIGNAADAATIAAVRLILCHRAMAHGNGRF
jgi:hypothetical protein